MGALTLMPICVTSSSIGTHMMMSADAVGESHQEVVHTSPTIIRCLMPLQDGSDLLGSIAHIGVKRNPEVVSLSGQPEMCGRRSKGALLFILILIGQ